MDLYPYGRAGDEISKNWIGLDTNKCDMCGKHHRFIYWTYTHYFRTLDGGDYISQDECLVCHISGHIRGIKHRTMRKCRVLKNTHEIWAMMTKLPWYSHRRLSQAIKFGRLING